MSWLDNIVPDYDVAIEILDRCNTIYLEFSRNVDCTVYSDLMLIGSKPGFTIETWVHCNQYQLEYPSTYKSSSIKSALIKLFESHNLTIKIKDN